MNTNDYLYVKKINSLEEPCAGCARPYGYKNAMALSADTRSFTVSSI